MFLRCQNLFFSFSRKYGICQGAAGTFGDIFPQSWQIFSLWISRVSGLFTKTRAFKNTHKKKSRWVKTGNLVGQWKLQKLAFRWPGILALRILTLDRAVYGFALSCWRHIFSGPMSSSCGRKKSIIIVIYFSPFAVVVRPLAVFEQISSDDTSRVNTTPNSNFELNSSSCVIRGLLVS